MIDWRGNFYDIGSTVLYPRMSGRSVEMTEAEVVDIKVKLVDVVWNENQWDWDKRIGLPKFEGTQYKPETKNPGYGYRRYARYSERTSEYEAWQEKCAAIRRENPRLTETTVREDFTVMLLPINSSRFSTGKISKEVSRERGLARLEAEGADQQSYESFLKWNKEQKPVRITIIENITVI